MFTSIKVKSGVPMSLAADDNPTFDEWMKRCDALCCRARGVSIHDLPDVAWSDWFGNRLRPIRAVNRALKQAF